MAPPPRRTRFLGERRGVQERPGCTGGRTDPGCSGSSQHRRWGTRPAAREPQPGEPSLPGRGSQRGLPTCRRPCGEDGAVTWPRPSREPRQGSRRPSRGPDGAQGPVGSGREGVRLAPGALKPGAACSPHPRPGQPSSPRPTPPGRGVYTAHCSSVDRPRGPRSVSCPGGFPSPSCAASARPHRVPPVSPPPRPAPQL